MSSALVITLISQTGLSQEAIAAASDALRAAGGSLVHEAGLDPPHAHDLFVEGLSQPAARAAVEAIAHGFDVVAQRTGPHRRKRLLVADMDSTMIGQECIDELADFAGKKAEISAITEAAMQGHLDFAEALDARVAALAGLDTGAIQRCLDERITLTPGARTLVATMQGQGARTVLVSGGFTAFTSIIADMIGFNAQFANVLMIVDGKLTGAVAKPIVDSSAKRARLIAERQALALASEATLAVGDGANDIPMLEAAGLGIAYHAKPTAAAAADAAIRLASLEALLWAQGLPRAEWTQG